jgi:hypothetical protein
MKGLAILMLVVAVAAGCGGTATADSTTPSTNATSTWPSAPPSTTPAPPPVDAAAIQRSLIGKLKHRFPKVKVTCDGTTSAACTVVLSDDVGTSPEVAIGGSVDEVYAQLTLPTKRQEATARRIAAQPDPCVTGERAWKDGIALMKQDARVYDYSAVIRTAKQEARVNLHLSKAGCYPPASADVTENKFLVRLMYTGRVIDAAQAAQ